MNKAIAALAITVAALLLSTGTVHADPSGDTAAYKYVCRMLDGGASPDQVVDAIMHVYGGSLDGDRLIVMTAIDAYCPNHVAPHWQWTN